MYIKKKKEDKQKKDNEVDFVTLIAKKLEISKREVEDYLNKNTQH